MNDRWEQLAPLTGVVFVALLVAGTLLIGSYDFLPPGDEIKSFYEDGTTTIRTGAYLILVSVAFFLGSWEVSAPACGSRKEQRADSQRWPSAVASQRESR